MPKKRKTPKKHVVKSHQRKGTRGVRSYTRGKGTIPTKVKKRKKVRIPEGPYYPRKFKIGDEVESTIAEWTGKIVGYSDMKAADEWYKKHVGMSIYETVYPTDPTENVYIVNIEGEKQPIPESELMKKET